MGEIRTDTYISRETRIRRTSKKIDDKEKTQGAPGDQTQRQDTVRDL